jgi:hypothetical protein
VIITLVFEKNANLFAENWQKSPKIVIITSTPDLGPVLPPGAADRKPSADGSAVPLAVVVDSLGEAVGDGVAQDRRPDARHKGPMLTFFIFSLDYFKKCRF